MLNHTGIERRTRAGAARRHPRAGRTSGLRNHPGRGARPSRELEFYADPASPYYRAEFDPAGRIILHCASGGRSALAAVILRELGYAQVAHLDGGLKAWKEQGYPVEGDGAPN